MQLRVVLEAGIVVRLAIGGAPAGFLTLARDLVEAPPPLPAVLELGPPLPVPACGPPALRQLITQRVAGLAERQVAVAALARVVLIARLTHRPWRHAGAVVAGITCGAVAVGGAERRAVERGALEEVVLGAHAQPHLAGRL